MLSVKGLHVSYGAIRAVSDINLNVEKGEVVMIIGANGAGKSTILRSIMGLNKQVSGEIRFNDVDLRAVPPSRIIQYGIAIVPEGRRMLGGMTVRENLELGAYILSDPKRVKQNIERMFSLFPRLKERENQLAGSLSGGEQQMVAIARALMSNPKLILMDEPSMGLAPVITEHIYENIKEIKKEGTSILLVEQNAYMAMTVADRGYVLQNGRIVFSGTVDELKENANIREAYLGI